MSSPRSTRPSLSVTRSPASPALPSLDDLTRAVQTWESNHRMLMDRAECIRRISALRARYLQWALDELRTLYDAHPEHRTEGTVRMSAAAADLAALDMPVPLASLWDAPADGGSEPGRQRRGERDASGE